MALAAFYPPGSFIFEDFSGYEDTGESGILEDYTPYLVFTGRWRPRAPRPCRRSG